MYLYLINDTNYKSFSLKVSSNLRHIIPILNTVEQVSSYDINIDNKTVNGIIVPWLNFSGPSLLLLNSSAQTTCPIANEYGRQFNTAGLSYNTDREPFGLIQMQSSLELIIKEGTEFRIWLMDIFGEYVKINSPMYVQVTVEPFNNDQSMSRMTG